MNTQAISHHPIALHDTHRSGGAGLVRFVMDRFLLLPLGAAIALVWANMAAESYFRFSFSIAFAVNEIGMALFIALVAQEVLEALMPGGALHSWRRWGMPLAGAAGGIAGAAGVYLLYVHLKYETVLSLAWPIACAVDVAAAFYVLKLISPRSNALPFLLLLVLATDAFGLLVVALRSHTVVVRPEAALLLATTVGLAALLRSWNVRSFWPYIVICGTLSWWALYLSGVHPALALLPIVPFLPHEPRRLNLFADVEDNDTVHHGEHEWNGAVQVVLFLFGLVNAGVLLRGYGTGSWAVLTAALVGRPLGVLAGVGVAALLGLRLPRHVGWRELTVVALATSSGFTFALFLATGIIPIGPLLTEIKIGALASVVAALLAVGVARLLRVGRFAARKAL